MADPTPAPTECPKCGAETRRDATELGTFIVCEACGFEAAEQLELDFETD